MKCFCQYSQFSGAKFIRKKFNNVQGRNCEDGVGGPIDGGDVDEEVEGGVAATLAAKQALHLVQGCSQLLHSHF